MPIVSRTAKQIVTFYDGSPHRPLLHLFPVQFSPLLLKHIPRMRPPLPWNFETPLNVVFSCLTSSRDAPGQPYHPYHAQLGIRLLSLVSIPLVFLPHASQAVSDDPSLSLACQCHAGRFSARPVSTNACPVMYKSYAPDVHKFSATSVPLRKSDAHAPLPPLRSCTHLLIIGGRGPHTRSRRSRGAIHASSKSKATSTYGYCRRTQR